MSDETHGNGFGREPEQGPAPKPGGNGAASAVTPPFDWGVGHVADSARAEPRHSEPYFTSTDEAATEPDAAAPADAAPAVAAPAFGPTAPAVAVPAAPAAGMLPATTAEPGPVKSPIDALFGETQFRDYQDQPLIGPIPTELNPFAGSGAAGSARPAGPAASDAAATVALGVPRSEATPAAPPPPVGAPPAGDRSGAREPLPKQQRIMFWVAGGVLAGLVLILLFAIGTKLPPVATPAPAVAASKSPSVTPSPTPTVVPAGPAAVGEHKWSDLRGGECLDPFTSPFAEKFTVVDCAAAHAAQLVFRGTFPAAAPAGPTATPAPTARGTDAGYPGLEALQAQINLLCTAPGVIDLATAGAYSDIQFQASYAANAAEWASGQHDYFCFVNRSGGQPITGSVAGTPVG
jgi:hypothetical protein